MHLYFIDDSGDPSGSTTHFVLGGVVIPGDQWHKLNDLFAHACEKFKVHGEIKWRLFGKKPKLGDRENPISHLNFEEKDELRNLLLESLVKFNSVKIIASVVHIPTIYSNHPNLTPENVYSMAYIPKQPEESVSVGVGQPPLFVPPPSLNFLSLAASAPASLDEKSGRTP